MPLNGKEGLILHDNNKQQIYLLVGVAIVISTSNACFESETVESLGNRMNSYEKCIIHHCKWKWSEMYRGKNGINYACIETL